MRNIIRTAVSLILLTVLCRQAVSAPASYHASDVMARVDGHVITRRQVTFLWLLADSTLQSRLGALLVQQYQGKNGLSDSYSVSAGAFYSALYNIPITSKSPPPWADSLSNLISRQVVADAAANKHQQVTLAQVKHSVHLLFNSVRKQHRWHYTDAQIIAKFHVPYSALLADMTMQMQVEKLYENHLARQIGHPIRPADWITVRCLYTSAAPSGGAVTLASVNAALQRIKKLAAKAAATPALMATLAEQNENAVLQKNDGLIGPTLYSTYWPAALQKVIYSLPLHTLSKPVFWNTGWWVFRVEQTGETLTAYQRDNAFNQLLANQRIFYIQRLRKMAHIVTHTQLPPDAVQAAGAAYPALPVLPSNTEHL